MIRKAKCSIWALCFPFFIWAQITNSDSLRIQDLNTRIEYSFFSDYPETIRLIDSLGDFTQSIQAWDSYLGALITKVSCSNLYLNTGEAEAQLAFLESEFERLETQLGTDRLSTQASMFSVKAEYFYQIGRFIESLEYYKSSNQLIDQVIDQRPDFSYYLLSNYQFIAEINEKVGNLREALEYYEASLQFYPPKATACSSNRSTLYRNLGEIYEALGNRELAREYYLSAIEEIRIGVEECPTFPAYLNNVVLAVYESMALYYAENGQSDSAQYYLDVLQDYPLSKDPKYYDYLADIERANGQLASAKAHVETAVQQKKSSLGKRHFEVSASLLLLGQIESESGENEQALNHFQEALISLSETFDSQEYANQPDIEEVYSDKLMLEILNEKLQSLLIQAKQESNSDYLQAALETSRTGIQLLDAMRLRSGSDEDRSFLSQQGYTLFEQGLSACFQLFEQNQQESYLAEAFSISEKSKAFNLLAAYRNAQARDVSGLPEKLANREYSLRAELQQVRETLYDARRAESLDEDQVASAQETVLQKQKDYRELIETIQNQHPEYYRLRYDARVNSLADIQSELKEETLLICYFIGREASYQFLISREQAKLIRLETSSALGDEISQMIRGLQNQDITEYTGLANRLYQQWCAGIDQFENIKSLRIVPDGALGYLPFEILLRKRPEGTDFRSYSYLLKDYSIAYAYSATLLAQNPDQSLPTSGRLLAFAPSFSSQSVDLIPSLAKREQSLDSLLYNIEETRLISKMSGGKSLIGNKANLDAFRSEASRFQFLHLASHGQVDDQEPRYSFIAFSPESGDDDASLLFMRDLYSLDLNAEMVVLSACQTGIGKYARGEGIQSMARAFSYAGASSIVTSLWSVNDQSTQELMIGFYQALEAGKSKDEALRQAKLDYLAESDAFQANPFYWAAFIAIGDMGPVEFEASGLPSWFWPILLIALMFFVFWIVQRFRQAVQ